MVDRTDLLERYQVMVLDPQGCYGYGQDEPVEVEAIDSTDAEQQVLAMGIAPERISEVRRIEKVS